MSGAGGAPSGAPPERVRPAATLHYVVIEDTVILFDTRADRYAAAPADVFHDALTHENGVLSPRTEALKRQLISEGLLVPQDFGAAARTLPKLGRGAFLMACLWAEYYLRRRRLDLALHGLQKKCGGGARSVSAKALERFQLWRPWYPRRNVCLFDSLALAAFLVAAGDRPEIVFGVRHPVFSAHCWLEVDGRVLNDEPAYCDAFVEILRVRTCAG